MKCKRWRWLKVVAAISGLSAFLALASLWLVPYPLDKLAPAYRAPGLLTDRFGTPLRTVFQSEGRRGTANWVRLDEIPSAAVLAVLASEDARFFEHPGVDWQAIGRAVWLNLQARRFAYGASTISMQVVRMVHLPHASRSVWRKVQQMGLALWLERNMSKRQILEQYLNRAYFGQGAYGIEAAARLYFGKSAASLSSGEATLLAVVPRAPTRYDLIKNLGAALARRDHIISLLTTKQLVSAEQVEQMSKQALQPHLHRAVSHAAHFVDWVMPKIRSELEDRGGVVRTSLDLYLQQALEHRVAEHVAEWRDRGLEQAGIVVLDTATSEVLAMVGSSDYQSAQLNITTRRRHPGSALKPFVYALALEHGATPASIAYDIYDVPSAYRLDRVTQIEHGPVRYREALSGSYNLAAVHVLEKVGVEWLHSVLNKAGLHLAQNPADYGLRLALGAAQVRLVDLAAAFGFMVRGGRIVPVSPIVEVKLADGAIKKLAAPEQRVLFSPEVSWLVMDMLSDADARHEAFGQELPLDLSFAVSAKTGTALGFSDTVAIAVTEQVTVAVWAGTFSGVAMEGLRAMTVAAPLVRDGLILAARGRKLTLPERPTQIVSAEICPLSGQLPGEACPHRKLEKFVAGTEPRTNCRWHAKQEGHIRINYPAEVIPWARRRHLLR